MRSIRIDSDERLLLVTLIHRQHELNCKIRETHSGYTLATTHQDALMRHLAELYFDIGIVKMNLTDQEKKSTENLIKKILAHDDGIE